MKNQHNLRKFAKELRKKRTDAEARLWYFLSNRQLGNHKFRRQQQVENCIVDFVCFENKLVIEVDGGHHYPEIGKGNDRLRDEHMKSLKLTVLRFSNSEVLNQTDSVVESIRQILLHPPFRKGDNP